MRFAERFARERKKNKLSAGTIARTLGISRSYIVLIENGQRRPASKIIPKIAAAFNLKTNIVLNWYLEDIKEKLNSQFKG